MFLANRSREVISDEEAEWRKGKTLHQIKGRNSIQALKGERKKGSCRSTGLPHPCITRRLERLQRIREFFQQNRDEHSTKSLRDIFPDIHERNLRIYLNFLKNNGELERTGTPSWAIWQLI